MNNLHYINTDLVALPLSNPPTGINRTFKLHACNAMGKWGRGIAHAFRDKYPEDYQEYQDFCASFNYKLVSAAGCSFTTTNKIICLITSEGYNPPDPEDQIMQYTYEALGRLLSLPQYSNIYSNRFNSGLFKVPWEKTEMLIKAFLTVRPDIKWTVCDL